MRRFVLPFGLLAMSFSVSACVSDAPRADLPSRPAGVEGRWADTSGIAVSTLAGGSFTSTDLNSGATLARGSYRTLTPTQIAIEYTRSTNGQKIAVNCNQVAADRLSCVNSGGTRFDLTRRA